MMLDPIDERVDIQLPSLDPIDRLRPPLRRRNCQDKSECQKARLIVRGRSSRWSLHPGISLGTTLERLEQLNGRPFTLAGFGWDYSGAVTDWRGGRLALSGRHANVYLSPPPSMFSSPAYSFVLGDKSYASDLPAMHELRPAVYQIFYNFPEAADSVSAVHSVILHERPGPRYQ